MALLDPYLQRSLLKGVPPLFTDIQSLYHQPGKAQLIEQLMYRYLNNLETSGTLDGSGKLEGRLSTFDSVELYNRNFSLFYMLSDYYFYYIFVCIYCP